MKCFLLAGMCAGILLLGLSSYSSYGHDFSTFYFEVLEIKDNCGCPSGYRAVCPITLRGSTLSEVRILDAARNKFLNNTCKQSLTECYCKNTTANALSDTRIDRECKIEDARLYRFTEFGAGASESMTNDTCKLLSSDPNVRK